MQLTLHPDNLIRIPQFPISARLEEEWEQLKSSIRLASEEFYEIIKDVSVVQLSNLTPEVAHTVWKYFNRARYRPTPFGSFAGIGVTKEGNGPGPITIADQVLHRFVCWTYDHETEHTDITDETRLFTNSTWYRVGGATRYISHFEDSFQLSETELSVEAVSLLEHCKVPITFKALKERPTMTADILARIPQLIDLQLLLTDKNRSIIGDDYFTRSGIAVSEELPQYVIAERQIISGSLDSKCLSHIPAMVQLLAKHAIPYNNPNLQQFIERFRQKFGQRMVPIMTALDPETGIGYADTEDMNQGDDLAASLASLNAEGKNKEKQSDLRDYVSHLMRRPAERVIRLEGLETQGKEADLRLPNSISVPCTIVDDLVIVDQVGGTTATALMARFGLGSADVAQLCREIAAFEQHMNPDVVFFDLSCAAEKSVDNVSRRRQVYPYQLSLLNYDLSEKPLLLSDMYLTVVGDELILYSPSLGKRLVPRLASAYNYTRSNLAVFRLLCDLQVQGLNTGLSPTLSELMPDLEYYPRVQYRNIVLSPEKWRVSYANMIREQESDGNLTSRLQEYLNGLGMGRFVATRTNDRSMVFDRECPGDVNSMLYVLKKFRRFYLEEAFVPVASQVRDGEGRPYCSQHILCLTHKETVYPGFTASMQQISSGRTKAVFTPGTEWLYFEIFCHCCRADFLLSEKIADFMAAHEQLIKTWFFIRYNSGGDHIRLRLRLQEPAALQPLITSFSTLLEEEVGAGTISDLRIATYRRETERYGAGAGGMEAVEHHFLVDSSYALNLIRAAFPIRDKYKLSIELILFIRDSGLFTIREFDRHSQIVLLALQAEHGIKAPEKKSLNAEYRQYRAHIPQRLTERLQDRLTDLKRSLLETLQHCPQQERGRLLIDLVHMHINRLFDTHQRTHEMIVYYLLSREVSYKEAMSVAQPSGS